MTPSRTIPGGHEPPPTLYQETSREGTSAGALAGGWIEVLLLATVFVAVNIAGALFQQQITYNHGKAWEGEFYYDVAEQFAQGRLHVASEAPLVYRVGTPFLAGLLHRWLIRDDLFLCFKIVNCVANALTLGLLIAWLRRFIGRWQIRASLGLAFLLQWDTPARWLYFYPAHTDPWMWVFLLAALLAVERYGETPSMARLALIAALAAVGVAFREVVLVVPVALLFVGNPVRGLAAWRWLGTWPSVRFPPWRLAVPAVAAVAALLSIRLLARQTNGYSFGLTAAHFLYDKAALVYLHGIFLSFGPMIWVPVLFWREARDFLASRQHLAAYLGAFMVLAFIGGTDTERLLYWSMPVVYVLIGRTLDRHGGELLRPRWLPASLAAAQLIASRAVFWPIPDYPNSFPYVWPLFTPYGRHVAFLQLYSFFDPHSMAMISLAEYALFGWLLARWLAFQRMRA